MEDNSTITFPKTLFYALLAILAGGSGFTGYAVKTETVQVTGPEIRLLMQDSLKPIELQANSINNQVSVIIYKQAEFERRLEAIERINRNAR
jgi:hypothetical protein